MEVEEELELEARRQRPSPLIDMGLSEGEPEVEQASPAKIHRLTGRVCRRDGCR